MIAKSVCVVAVCSSVSAQTVSTFDVDSEGWGLANDGFSLTWDGATGNPGGSINATDEGDGTIWYYTAPGKFLGDQSAAFGQTLSFDIRGIRGNHTSIPNRADVILIGNGGDDIGLVLNVQPMNGQWTPWSALLSGAAEWRDVNLVNGVVSGVVSEQRIIDILGDLEGVRIRGEFTSTANDSTAIDNVVLAPTPASWACLLFAGGIASGRRR